MKSKVIAIIVLAASFAAAVPDAVGRWFFVERLLRETGLISAAAQDANGANFRWNGRLAAGQTLELRGVNGDIRAEAATGDEIEVVARKSARRGNPEEVRIEVKEQSGGLIICAVYPDANGRRNECGGRMDTYNNDTIVNFTIKLPAGVNLKASTVNGQIKINDLRSNVKASTVNGDVKVVTSGEAEASTVNGDVHVTLGQSAGDTPLKYSTVNGDVLVNWTNGADISFRANTVNGDINSDFGFDSYEGKHGPKAATGHSGQGGRRVSLSTVNGSINLRGGAKL